MARRFMYVCFGILALVVAFHLGATSATSQLQGQVVGISGGGYMDNGVYVVTSEGDTYRWTSTQDFYYIGNPFGGVATQPTTWGKIKAEFWERE